MNSRCILAAIVSLTLLCIGSARSQSGTYMNGPTRIYKSTDISKFNYGGNSRLWAADEDRLKWSIDEGATWYATSVPLVSPSVVVVHPTVDGEIFVGDLEHLRKTVNHGATWTTPVFQINAVPLRLVVSSVPQNYWFFGTDTVKTGSSDADWRTSLYRSGNDGGTWSAVDYFRTTIHTQVNDVLAMPSTAFSHHVLVCGTDYDAQTASEIYSESQLSGLDRGIWLSNNDGVSWGEFTSNIPAGSRNVTAMTASVTGDNTLILAACAKNTGVKLFKSFNFAAWEGGVEFPNGPYYFRAMQTRPGNPQWIAAATDMGVYMSSDRGQSWTAKNDPNWSDFDARQVRFDPGGGTLYLSMFTGTYKSTDLGDHWQAIPSGSAPVSVSGVNIRGGNMLAVSSTYPAIFSSTGATWQQPVFPANHSFVGYGASLHVSSPYGYVSGQKDGKAALFSKDATTGAWSTFFDGQSGNQYFCGIPPDSKSGSGRIYAFGYNRDNGGSNVFWSEDLGQTWSTSTSYRSDIGGSSDTSTVLSLTVDGSGSGVPAPTLYAGLYSNGAYKSVDAGASWNSLSGLGSLTVNSIALEYSDPQTVYFGTSTGVYKSTNGGGNSTQMSTPGFTGASRVVARKVFASAGNQMWLVTQNQQDVYWSSNGGTSWTSFSTSSWPKPPNDMKLDLTANAYIYVGTSAGVYRIDPVPVTVTGVQSAPSGGHPGISWTAHPESDITKYKVYRYFRYCQYYFPNKQCGGAVETTCLTPDGITGTSFVDTGWDIICTGCVGSNLRIAGYYVTAVDAGSQESAASSTVEFTVGQEDDIQEKTVAESAPDQYSLGSNYPNPFNPMTTIAYGVPEATHVRLVVVDLLGREVALLVDEWQEAGYKSVKCDAALLSSGVYFYKLTAGSFTDVKKMVVAR
jgi:hypothetical protein